MKSSATFLLERRSSWGSTMNAGPEPINSGKRVKVTGTLKLADWQKDAYVGYFRRMVQVQFRAVGASTWKSLRSVKTSSTGKVSTTLVATKDGSWRLHSGGTSISNSASSGSDYVEVITAKDRKVFKNCTAMHAIYPHGVGKSGSHDQVRGSTSPVTDFVRNNHLYTVNKKSDRDHDDIDCEQL